MHERHVSELIAEVFRRAGMKRGVRRAAAVLLWRKLVGPELASFSTAVALRDGVLYVNVSDSETAMHLSMERHRFLAAYRDRYGVTDVREIRFQVGRLGDDEERGEERAALPEPDPREVERLRRDLSALGLPDDVLDAALLTGRSLLALQAARRELGWVPCPTCGALHDGPVRPESPRETAMRAAGQEDHDVSLQRALCQPCSRYAREGRVVAAAGKLRTSPMADVPGLAEEERAVAAYLARRSLDAAIASLLPAAIEDKRLALQLGGVARCRLALEHGRRPDTFTLDDVRELDPRVAAVLRAAGEEG